MARLNMVDAIDQALLQAMELDPKIVVLGEDVGRDGGVFRVTDGLIERFGEQRVIDTPLAESGIVGMAIGMAIAGYHPVAEIQFCGLLLPGVRPDGVAMPRACATAAGVSSPCPWSSGCPTAAGSGLSSTTRRAWRRVRPRAGAESGHPRRSRTRPRAF